MTPEETEAVKLFIRIVAEFDLAQDILDLKVALGNPRRKDVADQLNLWTNGLRAGTTQEYLNNLALKLVEQGR